MNPSTLLANLIAYSIQIALLVTAGTLVLRLLKVRHPGALLLYWQLLLGACLLLPVFQPWQKPAVRNFLTLSSRTTDVETTLGPMSAVPERFFSSELLAYAIAAGMGFRCLWLALGLLRLGQYQRQARLLNPPPPAVMEMQEKMGVSARVHVSAELHRPVTFGLRPPVLLLPSSFQDMELARQRAVVCHELWHIRRKDWVFILLEALVTTPLWFHPAVWWLLDRIRLCREQVVDQLVLKTTQQRKPYLDALLETALACQHPRFTPAPLFLSQRHLTQRVASIVKEVSMSKTRLAVSLAVASISLFLTGVAGVEMFPLESAGGNESAIRTG